MENAGDRSSLGNESFREARTSESSQSAGDRAANFNEIADVLREIQIRLTLLEVKQVELQSVLSQSAYMLLYARCSSRAPSLLRKEISNKSRLKQNGDCHNFKARSTSKPSHPRLIITYQGKNQASHSYDKTFRYHELFNERLRSKPDVSSDGSSLFSHSDEGSSWSAESTKDSATTEDFAEFAIGESGHINSISPPRFSENSDGMGNCHLISVP